MSEEFSKKDKTETHEVHPVAHSKQSGKQPAAEHPTEAGGRDTSLSQGNVSQSAVTAMGSPFAALLGQTGALNVSS